MLSDAIVEQVGAMLGWQSDREIALACHIARDSVARIRAGKWRGKRTPSKPPERDPEAPYERCNVCGHRVQMPCLVCPAIAAREELIRTLGQWHRKIRAGDVEPLGLELRPDDQARYEQVRRTAPELPKNEPPCLEHDDPPDNPEFDWESCFFIAPEEDG